MIHRRKPKAVNGKIHALGKPNEVRIQRALYRWPNEGSTEIGITVIGWRFIWNAKERKHEQLTHTHNHWLKGSLSRADKRKHRL